MIVIGYQGIGKSSLAVKNNRFIDLESSNFFIDGERDKNWYKIYCKIANELSKQGFVVFTSSHKEVRDELKKSLENIIICYPGIEMKEAWVNKLDRRYEETKLDKDYKALMNTKKYFEENIFDLSTELQFTHIVIHKMNYVLEDMLTHELDYFMSKYKGE